MRIHTFEITRFPDNVKHTRIYKPTIKESWQYIFSMLDPTDLMSIAYLDSEDEEIPDNDDL